MDGKEQSNSAPVIIKKYANRRLYNTSTSSYVTLDNLSQMVRLGTDFIVYDAKTSEDITRSVLTQIIVEEEQKGGQKMLPISFLRDLIGFYGNNMQWLVPQYLEYAMKSFSHNQENLAKSVGAPFGNMFPLGPFEDIGKKNMALFEQALRMFTPFPGNAAAPPVPPPPAPPPAPAADSNALAELTQRLNQLQSQLEDLSKKSG